MRKLPKSNINPPKSTLMPKEYLNQILKTIQRLENLINLEKGADEENKYQDINGLNEAGAVVEELQGKIRYQAIDKQTDNNHL